MPGRLTASVNRICQTPGKRQTAHKAHVTTSHTIKTEGGNSWGYGNVQGLFVKFFDFVFNQLLFKFMASKPWGTGGTPHDGELLPIPAQFCVLPCHFRSLKPPAPRSIPPSMQYALQTRAALHTELRIFTITPLTERQRLSFSMVTTRRGEMELGEEGETDDVS